MTEHHRNPPWSREEFEQRLRAKGALYHIHHPYHQAMHNGECNEAQIRGWVANRFYYQINIPVKDANVLANCRDRDERRQWVQRILDHDGYDGAHGGIEAWLMLGEAVGIDRDTMLSQELVLPGVRFAVDAYVNFARRSSWQEAACSSLTEMFAPEIHQSRLDTWPQNYPLIDMQGLQYFVTRQEQERALDILQFKLDILWTMLDAMTMAYYQNRAPYHNIEADGMGNPVRYHHGAYR